MDSDDSTDPAVRPLRVTVCRSTFQLTATVMRELDDDQRRLIVHVPWTQRPTDTYAAVRHLLTPEEAAALAAAFDLDQPARPAGPYPTPAGEP